MLSKNIFEIASRKKIRFDYKGSISVESLWGLSIKELDIIFKAVNNEAKKVGEESLLDEKSEEDTIAILKADLIRHVANTLKEETRMKKNTLEMRKQKEKLIELRSNKLDEDLKNLTLEELDAKIKALG